MVKLAKGSCYTCAHGNKEIGRICTACLLGRKQGYKALQRVSHNVVIPQINPKGIKNFKME